MKKLILMLLPFLLTFSCKTTKPVSPDTFQGNQLIFGNGGGVANQVTEYTLLENGQLFLKKSGGEERKEIKKLKAKMVKGIFSRAEKLNIDKTVFNHPGNMTFFVTLKLPAGSHTIQWGDNDYTVPPDILSFYNYLFVCIHP